MKNFFVRYYHLLFLGIALLIALASAAYLILQSTGFQNSFSSGAVATGNLGTSALPPSTNSVTALEHLEKKVVWNPRDDGASPLVSRPYLLNQEGKLIDPMSSTEPLYPPVPNQWLMDHQLDYTDMNILDRDPKHKGFTVLEEFKAGTDPNNPNQFPLLYNKLSYTPRDIDKQTYVLEFTGLEEYDGHKEYSLRLTAPPDPSKGNRTSTSTKSVLMGDTIPGASFLKLVEYNKKSKTDSNDIVQDVSELVIQNTLTGELLPLVHKYISREYKPRPIEVIKSVTFHYQLAGVPSEEITVERGKEFSLPSLDRKHIETYKLADFSSEGVVLDKDGKSFTVKPSSAVNPPQSIAPAPAPTPAP